MNEMRKLCCLVQRNTKCYFKDKFTFFMSLITPLILLVLFATFLRNVYIDSFTSAFPEGFECDWRIVEGITGAWLMSSIVSVSSVTVAFCSNLVMVQDKVNGTVNDFFVSPVKKTTIQIGYFISNFFVTLLVLLSLMLIGFIYLAAVGWYIPVGDVFMIIVDIVCNVLFGTLLAAIVHNFVSTEGGMSAVSTLVSSMYGFISGAYMPLSQFAEGLRNVICLLPGTYGVGILRNHYMNGYLTAFSEAGIPAEGIEGMKNAFDANMSLFGNNIPLGGMYGILLGACAVLFAAFVALVIIKKKKK